MKKTYFYLLLATAALSNAVQAQGESPELVEIGDATRLLPAPQISEQDYKALIKGDLLDNKWGTKEIDPDVIEVLTAPVVLLETHLYKYNFFIGENWFKNVFIVLIAMFMIRTTQQHSQFVKLKNSLF